MQSADLDVLAGSLPEPIFSPRYNIAPTQPIACIHRPDASSDRTLMAARWGLIPSWAKDVKVGYRMINARGETVAEKRSFQKPLQKRRCLIPTDGYYEWQKTADGKQPYLISKSDDGLLAMAGLWEQNFALGENDQPLVTCTIITTAANEVSGQIHDRMPVFLAADDHERWLDPTLSDTEQLSEMLLPADNDLLSLRSVSKTVNNARNEGPGCIEPAS